MRNVLVTGGSRGIGLAIARRLAGSGDYNVIAIARRESEDLGQAIRGMGADRLHFKAFDLSETNAIPLFVKDLRDEFGPIYGLVNNAGIVQQARFVDLTPADFDRMFAVHVRGAFLCTRAVLPAMLAKKSGIVINVASQLGQIGGVELVHYSAAKAAIIGMTKSLAREVSALGVRVNAVAPGPINTPLVMALSQDWRQAKARELPLGRFGEPDEVAATVSFLASPEASLFVGQTLGPNSGDVML